MPCDWTCLSNYFAKNAQTRNMLDIRAGETACTDAGRILTPQELESPVAPDWCPLHRDGIEPICGACGLPKSDPDEDLCPRCNRKQNAATRQRKRK